MKLYPGLTLLEGKLLYAYIQLVISYNHRVLFLHLEVESVLDLISHKEVPQPLIYGEVKINEGEFVEI